MRMNAKPKRSFMRRRISGRGSVAAIHHDAEAAQRLEIEDGGEVVEVAIDGVARRCELADARPTRRRRTSSGGRCRAVRRLRRWRGSVPRAPKNLSAFHSAALWLAPMEMPPAASSRRMACWMTGVETTPRSMTSWPQASRPAITPSRIMTPLARGSRPITTGPGLEERTERGGEIEHVRRRQSRGRRRRAGRRARCVATRVLSLLQSYASIGPKLPSFLAIMQ